VARLYVHGHPVIDYVKIRRGKELGPNRADEEYDESTYRLMSDGKLLKQYRSGWVHEGKIMKTSSGWKIAKVKPEIATNPDHLIELGFKKVQP